MLIPDPARNFNRYFVILFFFVLYSIFQWNTFTHAWNWMYDTNPHLNGLLTNHCWGFIETTNCARSDNLLDTWTPHNLTGIIQYNPPYYYFIWGKLAHGFELLLKFKSTPPRYYQFYIWTVRLFHAAAILLLGYLFSQKFVPNQLKASKSSRLAPTLCLISLFTIPNLFLAQVMVRSDHMLFLGLCTLYYLWFQQDYPGTLARSRTKQWMWGALLVFIANSRHIAFPAFALFFCWGAWILWRTPMPKMERLKSATIVLLVICLSGQFYVRSIMSNETWGGPKENGVMQPEISRVPLFTNLQFGRLLETPNREALFDNDNNAFLPRLYGDMWGDHWLYFSHARWEDPSDEVNAQGNAWGKREGEGISKFRIFKVAVFFTFLYFLFPLVDLIVTVRQWIKFRAPPNWHQTASLLFLGGLVFLVTYIYREPKFGENDTVKFVYLFGYIWMPVFPMIAHLAPHRRLLKLYAIYAVALFICCLPLIIYG